MWLHFNAARADGLSSEDEAADLLRIEDQLVPTIKLECQAQLVGRITGAGRREFYFYSAAESSLESIARTTMASFPAYRFDIGEQNDPSWGHYLDVLYPTPREMMSIQNRRVLDQLEKNGDDHAISRPVDRKRHADHTLTAWFPAFS